MTLSQQHIKEGDIIMDEEAQFSGEKNMGQNDITSFNVIKEWCWQHLSVWQWLEWVWFTKHLDLMRKNQSDLIASLTYYSIEAKAFAAH